MDEVLLDLLLCVCVRAYVDGAEVGKGASDRSPGRAVCELQSDGAFVGSLQLPPRAFAAPGEYALTLGVALKDVHGRMWRVPRVSGASVTLVASDA